MEERDVPRPTKAPKPHRLVIRHAGLSDVGRERNHNEDFLLIDEEERLFAVADGMGGHAAGEVASRMAGETVSQFFKKSREGDVTWPFKIDPDLPLIENRLICGLKLSNYHIFLESRADLKRKGMGTTMVAAALDSTQIHIAHVGDSRAYRLRNDTLDLLTTDHTLLEDVRRYNPEMTAEEMRNFPHRGVLSRALGVREQVEVDVQRHDLLAGDLYLLCSDGLYGQVEDPELLAVLADATDLESAARSLIELANAAGGPDNITVALISCDT
jgi:serine/threonine protein phosphatase PrpC